MSVLDPSSVANTALSITGSIVSILTFLYALLVTFYLYAKTAVSSPQEINEFILSLQFSFEEIQAFAHSYANFERERQHYYYDYYDEFRQPQYFLDLHRQEDRHVGTVGADPEAAGFAPTPLYSPPEPDPEAQSLKAKARLIELHTSQRLESLRQLALRVGTMSSDGFFKRWSNRLRYALLQEEVNKQVTGKDKLMEELRRVKESFDKTLLDRRRRHHDALVQHQTSLLGEIMHRLDALEERSTATVQGSTDAGTTSGYKSASNGASRHYEEIVQPSVSAPHISAKLGPDQCKNGVGDVSLTPKKATL